VVVMSDNAKVNGARFPDRPQHPDFGRIAAALNALDGATLDAGPGLAGLTKILAPLVDVDSVGYAARERATLGLQAVVGHSAVVSRDKAEVTLAAMFANGFAAGVLFERAGGTQ
jgi:hypothetical protein